jgi:hypothetical protein
LRRGKIAPNGLRKSKYYSKEVPAKQRIFLKSQIRCLAGLWALQMEGG